MTKTYPFQQVDVFSAQALKGNPLAVVCDADDWSDEQMAAFANWTNLSETTFLLKPTSPEADYRVRIFTTSGELPFAGHPTLGTCHVWLSRYGKQGDADVVQECGVGLVRIRRAHGRLAFAAPPLRRSGPVEPEILKTVSEALGLADGAIVDANWTDNGPRWMSILLRTRREVLAIQPNFAALAGSEVGVVAPCHEDDGVDADFEIRGFMVTGTEDPVTGSLNAGTAQWLIGAGIALERYVASQGTVLGRAGRVHIEKADGEIWVGGDVATLIEGVLSL